MDSFKDLEELKEILEKYGTPYIEDGDTIYYKAGPTRVISAHYAENITESVVFSEHHINGAFVDNLKIIEKLRVKSELKVKTFKDLQVGDVVPVLNADTLREKHKMTLYEVVKVGRRYFYCQDNISQWNKDLIKFERSKETLRTWESDDTNYKAIAFISEEEYNNNKEYLELRKKTKEAIDNMKYSKESLLVLKRLNL